MQSIASTRGVRWGVLVATAAVLGMAGPVRSQEVLSDGREVLSLGEFNQIALGLGIQGAPFDRSVLGYFDALGAFFQFSQSGIAQTVPFDAFTRAASSAVDRVPVPSGSTSVSYRYDPALETYVRYEAPLAPSLSQNARTNGKGVVTIGFAFSELDYDQFDGRTRHDVQFSAFGGPVGVPGGVIDLATRFDFELVQRVYATSLSYGVLDNLDIGVLIPVIESEFEAISTGRFFILDEQGRYSPAVLNDLPGGGISVDPDAALPVSYAGLGAIGEEAFVGGFERSIFGLRFQDDTSGIGDVVVRARYYAGSIEGIDYGGSLAMTTPTGDEDDLLGLDAWRFDPRFLVSTSTERVAAHVNVGFHVDSDESDRNRFDYSVGAEARVTSWLTFLLDHLGRLEVEGPRKIQSYEIAPGVKANLFRDFIAGANLILPLNEDGLTAEFVPNVIVEASMVF